MYLTATLMAMLAISSLAVDLGRVYVVRSELQLAADAAARYAAAGFKDGITVSQDYAIDAADDNTADGVPVVLDRNQDIEFGTWDATAKTFTPLAGVARANANAIRVTACRTSARGNPVQLMLAGAVGRSTCNARAVSVVRIATPIVSGFVGTGSVQAGNNTLIASYNPALGAPGGGNVESDAVIGSNGDVQVGNNSMVRGDVLTDDYSAGNGSTLDGDQEVNHPQITYPATESPTVPSNGALLVSTNTTMTLPAGTYNYTSIVMETDATLRFAGQATVYVTGTITLGSGAALVGSADRPGNLNVRIVGTGGFSAENNATLIAHLYAPRSAVEFGNNAHVRGSIAADQLEFGNNAVLYFDRTTAPSSASGVVILD